MKLPKMPGWMIKAGGKLREVSPEVCVYGGIGLMLGGFVWGCVQTAKKMDDILDEHETAIEEIKATVIDDEYTEKDQKRDICKAHGQMILSFLSAYKGPIACEAAGSTLISVGFGKMKKKYLGTAALLETTIAAYDNAMDRAAELGEDTYHYVKYGEKPEEVEDPVTGEKKKIYKGSETDIGLVRDPFEMWVDRGHLYEQAGGDAVMLCELLRNFEDAENVQYCAGTPVYYYDALRYIFGNELVSKLKECNLIDNPVLRELGHFSRDPENAAKVQEIMDNEERRYFKKPFSLRIDTVLGKNGDDDPYDQDKVYVRICPNVPGVINLSSSKNKARVGGKYLSQV